MYLTQHNSFQRNGYCGYEYRYSDSTRKSKNPLFDEIKITVFDTCTSTVSTNNGIVFSYNFLGIISLLIIIGMILFFLKEIREWIK